MPDFATQGRLYIDRLKTRNRRPIKPATAAAFEGYLRNHIVPCIGDAELQSFNNSALKDFVQTLMNKGLSPKSIAEISAFTRSIVGSVLDADGNQIYPRTWNQEFVDAPPIVRQHQPVCTKEMIKEALRVRHARTDKHRVLIALLLASGIRVGELLALRCSDDGRHSGWDEANSLLAIRTSLWRGVEQTPKTLASIRFVDLSTPVNEMLAAHVAAAKKKPADFLFATRKGTPLSPGGLYERVLVPLGIPGFHSCRRWRVSFLKKARTPDSLLKAWIGHSPGDQSWESDNWGNDLTAIYDKSAADTEWCRKVVNHAGIGFELPDLSVGRRPAPSVVSTPPEIAEHVAPFVASDDDLPSQLFEQEA
jgi:integrase